MSKLFGGGWTITLLAMAFLLLEVVGILAMVLTGNWPMPAPPAVLMINPIIGWVHGFEHPLVPVSFFDSLPLGMFTSMSASAPAAAANVLVYSALQWLGLGFLLDLIRQRAG